MIQSTKCNAHSLIHIFDIRKSWNTQSTSNFYDSHKLNMISQVYRLYRWDFEHRKFLNSTKKSHFETFFISQCFHLLSGARNVFTTVYISHHGLHILHSNFWLIGKFWSLRQQVFNLLSRYFLQLMRFMLWVRNEISEIICHNWPLNQAWWAINHDVQFSSYGYQKRTAFSLALEMFVSYIFSV